MLVFQKMQLWGVSDFCSLKIRKIINRMCLLSENSFEHSRPLLSAPLGHFTHAKCTLLWMTYSLDRYGWQWSFFSHCVILSFPHETLSSKVYSQPNAGDNYHSRGATTKERQSSKIDGVKSLKKISWRDASILSLLCLKLSILMRKLFREVLRWIKKGPGQF